MRIVADTNTVISGLLWSGAPHQLINAARRRRDDAAILACAIAAQVDAIVSGDNDLRVLTSYQGIPILSAAGCLKKIRR